MPPLRVQHRSGVDREEKVLVPGAKLPRRSGATAGHATGGGEVRHRFLSINNQITTFLPSLTFNADNFAHFLGLFTLPK